MDNSAIWWVSSLAALFFMLFSWYALKVMIPRKRNHQNVSSAMVRILDACDSTLKQGTAFRQELSQIKKGLPSSADLSQLQDLRDVNVQLLQLFMPMTGLIRVWSECADGNMSWLKRDGIDDLARRSAASIAEERAIMDEWVKTLSQVSAPKVSQQRLQSLQSLAAKYGQTMERELIRFAEGVQAGNVPPN